jgi:hypothetical protein
LFFKFTQQSKEEGDGLARARFSPFAVTVTFLKIFFGDFLFEKKKKKKNWDDFKMNDQCESPGHQVAPSQMRRPLEF